jgi:hypothetical protein
MFVGKALQLYVTLMKHIMLIGLKYWSSTLYSFSRERAVARVATLCRWQASPLAFDSR